MQSREITTPFGRRRMSLAMMKGQLAAAEISPGTSVDKWKVFRDASEARERLGIADRSLAILNALLSFYPETQLCEENGLVVFPSNNQLSLRAHGITGTTLRRHLAALVEAGLITRKDSPNGKRYARKDSDGDIENAFGFSLAPLLVRAGELAQMAQDVVEERRALRIAREQLSICRRDIRKLISAAIEEAVPGDWAGMEGRFVTLLAGIPRAPSLASTRAITTEMEALRAEILKCLENQINFQKKDGNDNHSERHIQNTKPDSIIEVEPGLEKAPETKSLDMRQEGVQPVKAFPLGLVLKACTEITAYGPGGTVTSWRDLLAAAAVVRSMLGVSPSAWQDACDVLGPENAAVTMACILERAEQVQSAGGYLRELTRRAERGEFSPGPMLMALLRLDRASGGENRITPAAG